MSSYRKTMSESYNSMYLVEDNVDILRNIVKKKQMMPIKFADGKMGVDLFTASAVTQALDKVNDKNREKLTKLINTGKKSAFASIAKVVMKSENDPEIEEELGLNESGHTDVASAQNNVKVAMSAIQKMSGELSKLNPEDALPSWWTNKVAIAVDKLDGMADYLDTQVEAVSMAQQAAIAISKKERGNKPKKEEVELDEFTVSDVEIAMKKKYGKVDKEAIEKLKKVQHMGNVDRNALVKVGHGKLHVESVELDEAKYDLYHKDFSSAMQHAYAMAKKLHGITIDPKEIDDKVATGPSKPSSGKTNKYRLKGDKGAIQVQVYNKGGSKPFELNMYKEEVELDELKPASRHVGKSQKNPDMFAVYDNKGKEVKLFKDEKDAEEYAIKNHEEIMGHDKPKNVKEELDIDEGFSSKEIKMAIGVASDKRYAGGNMTGAANAIDKIKKGLSDHPQVAAVLRRQNEEVDLDEHKGTEPHKHPHPKDVDEASARSDAMRAMGKGKSVDPADIDNTATDDDVKAASKNIMMQLRKAISLRGTFSVEFGDKKKVKVSSKIASAVASKYNSLRRPADKEKFQTQIAKSYKDLLKGIKEETMKESKFSLINKQLKGEK